MKKFIAALLAVLMLLGLCACSGFNNVSSYVNMADYKDGSVIFITNKDVTEKVDDALKSLLEAYPGIRDITTGTIVYDSNKDLPDDFISGSYTVYIYYTSTLEMLNDTIKIKLGESGVTGFDEALKAAEFKDGVAEFKLPLGDVTASSFEDAFKAIEDEEDETSEEPSSANAEATAVSDDAEPAPQADESTSTSTSEDTETTKKEHNFKVTIAGQNGKITAKDGDEITLTIEWTVPEYTSYTAEDDEEKEEDETSEEPEEDEEEETKKGYAYIMPSDPDDDVDEDDAIEEDSSFVTGFAAKLVGQSVAVNTKVPAFTLQFPKDHKTAILKEKNITYEVTILEVEIEFRRDIEDQEEFDTLKKDYLKANEDAEFEYENKAELMADYNKSAKEVLAVEAMMANSTMKKWPISQLDEYYNMLYNYYYMMYYSYFQNASTAASYVNSMEKDLYDEAGKSLKQDLILYQIAKDQNLTDVTSEQILDFYGDEETRDSVIDSYGKKYVKRQVAINEAQKWLGENVEVK